MKTLFQKIDDNKDLFISMTEHRELEAKSPYLGACVSFYMLRACLRQLRKTGDVLKRLEGVCAPLTAHIENAVKLVYLCHNQNVCAHLVVAHTKTDFEACIG